MQRIQELQHSSETPEGEGRADRTVRAQAAFIQLGRLEAYSDRQLAPFLSRSRSWVTRVAAVAIDERALRIARTLVRDARLRRQLRPVAAP